MTDGELYAILESYPDLVADALGKYKISLLESERTESKVYLTIKTKMTDTKPTETTLKHLVRLDPEYFSSQMDAIKAEIDYTRHNEKLLAAKKMSQHRTAF